MELEWAGKLFAACTEVYSYLGKSWHHKSTIHLDLFRNEATRLYIWGNGFRAFHGGLDELLTLHGVGDLRNSCLIVLGSIGHVFTGHFLTMDAQTTLEKQHFLDALYNLLGELEYIIPELSEYHYEGGGDDQEAIEELKGLNDCLYDLVPVLERVVALSTKSQGSILAQEFSENTAHNLDDSARVAVAELDIYPLVKIFEDHIFQRLPKINPQLLRRLAEATHNRYNRLMDLQQQEDYDDGDGEHTDQNIVFHEKDPDGITKNELCDDRTHNKSKTVTEDTPLAVNTTETLSFDETQSQFSDSAYSSVGSAVATDAANGFITKFPPPPVRLEDKVPFRCPYCYKTLNHIASPNDWKEHLLNDLEPWICTLGNCPKGSIPFRDKKEWSRHEIEDHRTNYRNDLTNSTFSETCQFCKIPISGTMKKVIAHSAKHLKEIALPVLHMVRSAVTRENFGIPQYEYGQGKMWEMHDDRDSSNDDEVLQKGNKGKAKLSNRRLFACPYYKDDPQNVKFSSCAAWYSNRLDEVKGHCKTHLRHLLCGRCKTFRAGTYTEIFRHLEDDTCQHNISEKIDIDIDTARYKAHDVDKAQTWEKIYEMLFHIHIPSPYLKNQTKPPKKLDSSPFGNSTNDNDNDNDEFTAGPSKKRKRSSNAQGEARVFACPYFKKEPQNVEFERCAGWSSIKLVPVK